MRVFRTTDTGDFYVKDGRFEFLEGINALKQICENVMRAQVGSYALDKRKGVDYFGNVFTGSPDLVKFRSQSIVQLMKVNGVISVSSFTTDLVNDQLLYTATIRTIYGNLSLSAAEITSQSKFKPISPIIPTPPVDILRDGLRQWITRFPESGSTDTYFDQLGFWTRPKAVKNPCLTFTGDEKLTGAWITGSETITSQGGTAVGTVAAGEITFTAGTLWNLTLSTGHHFHIQEAAGDTLYCDVASLQGDNLTIVENGVVAGQFALVSDGNQYYSGTNFAMPLNQDYDWEIECALITPTTDALSGFYWGGGSGWPTTYARFFAAYSFYPNFTWGWGKSAGTQSNTPRDANFHKFSKVGGTLWIDDIDSISGLTIPNYSSFYPHLFADRSPGGVGGYPMRIKSFKFAPTGTTNWIRNMIAIPAGRFPEGSEKVATVNALYDIVTDTYPVISGTGSFTIEAL